MASGLQVATLEPLLKLSLRARLDDSGFGEGAEPLLGCEVPRQVGAAARNNATWVLCLGPGEWLALRRSDGPGSSLAGLQCAAAGARGAAVETSAAFAATELRGPAVRGLIAKGCSLDVHPRAFGPLRCARTLIARVPVVLMRPDSDETFWVLAGSSYASWLGSWIRDAAEDL